MGRHDMEQYDTVSITIEHRLTSLLRDAERNQICKYELQFWAKKELTHNHLCLTFCLHDSNYSIASDTSNKEYGYRIPPAVFRTNQVCANGNTRTFHGPWSISE